MDLGKIGYQVYLDDAQYLRMLRQMRGDTQETGATLERSFSRLGGIIAAAFSFREAIRQARNLSAEIANIKSIATEFDAKVIRKELESVDAALGNTAEIANALFFAYSSGVRGTEKELVAFTAQIAGLAKSTGSEVTPVMNAITTMMASYNLSVKDAGMLSDWFFQIIKAGKTSGPELANSLGMIASTAASAHVSIDDLGAGIATLTTTMPTAQAITSLNQAILSFVKPTADAEAMAESLGIKMSAAELKARGFTGMMNLLNEKCKGNVAVMGQLFTSVEALKAALALAGTQNAMYNDILDEFHKKAGVANTALQEILSSDDAKLKTLTTVLEKIAAACGKLFFHVMTANGALNGFYSMLGRMSSTDFSIIAKVITLTAALIGLKRAAALAKSVGTALSGLATRVMVSGGYQTVEMRAAAETAAVQQAEAAKTASVQANDALKAASAAKSTALRETLEARRHLAVMQHAAAEAAAQLAAENAVLAAKKASALTVESSNAQHLAQVGQIHATEMAAENAKLASIGTRVRQMAAMDEKIRLQYALMGQSGNYTAHPMLIAAQKEYAAQEALIAEKQKAHAKEMADEQKLAATKTANAQKEIADSERVALARQKALAGAQAQASAASASYATSKTSAIAAGNAYTQAAASAQTAAEAERNLALQTTNANVAMDGAPPKIGRVKGALKGLWAAIAANPLGLLLIAVSVAWMAISSIMDKAREKAEKALEDARKAVSDIGEKSEKNDKTRAVDLAKMKRLEQLANKQNKSNEEIAEQARLVSEITSKYGSLGGAIGEIGGKLNLAADAIERLVDAMREQKIEELAKKLEAKKKETEMLKSRYTESQEATWGDASKEYFWEFIAQNNLGFSRLRQYAKQQALSGQEERVNERADPIFEKLKASQAEQQVILDELNAMQSGKKAPFGANGETEEQKAVARLDIVRKERANAITRARIKATEESGTGTLSTDQASAIARMELDALKADLAEKEAEFRRADANDGSKKVDAEQKVLALRLQIVEKEKALVKQQYDLQDAKLKAHQQIQILTEKNLAMEDGYITNADRAALNTQELRQTRERLEVLSRRVKQTPEGAERDALKIQLETERGKQLELERERLKLETETDPEKDRERKNALTQWRIDALQDGKITNDEEQSRIEMETRGQKDLIAELQGKLKIGGLPEDIRKSLEDTLLSAQLRMAELGSEYTDLQKKRSPDERSSVGAFGAAAASYLSTRDVDKEQLDVQKKILRKMEKETGVVLKQ